MIYLVVVFALLAVLISWILIEMGISDSDNVSTGLGVALLIAVIIIGVCFYLGNKIPLVVVSLMIGLPMSYNACKSMAACPKESPYSTGDKIIGMSYWLFTMLFLAIAFYYWYYIPERVILPIVMGLSLWLLVFMQFIGLLSRKVISFQWWPRLFLQLSYYILVMLEER